MVISNDWLAGFIEGEGNFHISLSSKHKSPSWAYPFEFYPILQFRIFLREDDHDVLKKIHEKLGFGRIYHKNYDYTRKMGFNSKDQFAFYVTSSKDLLKLKEILLSTEFYSKKCRDRDLFFKILDMKLKGKHMTQEGHDEIVNLCKTLNSGNRDAFNRKNTVKRITTSALR
ncbi:hypothetical protein COU61_02465 [Candidatus Pacearchaeota archaeon CG10_big_fil_rev_8_21_14_0_10_35_13]|nr:MAG: hypothetical protein COU61_02465 [Candidatus Pacearchaeota archaeon CG10_big_fil_rev_8_21_14_0_10_35_13]